VTVIRAATVDDRRAVAEALAESWGNTTVVAHGIQYDAALLPALVAERDGRLVGVLTYSTTDAGLEVVSLDALQPRNGVGSALLVAAADLAREAGISRVWLVTTNDNLDALRFYQRRGMRIVAVTPGAIDAARLVKPSIPLTGDYGIGLHDELTLELLLP
jgi:ribosomal protein S18 acetylase RimI-like enzyme